MTDDERAHVWLDGHVCGGPDDDQLASVVALLRAVREDERAQCIAVVAGAVEAARKAHVLSLDVFITERILTERILTERMRARGESSS